MENRSKFIEDYIKSHNGAIKESWDVRDLIRDVMESVFDLYDDYFIENKVDECDSEKICSFYFNEIE